jgi:hypothetical protein
MLDTVLPRMKAFGRIPVCGMIANYNHQSDPYRLRNIWQVLVNRITMRGFLAYSRSTWSTRRRMHWPAGFARASSSPPRMSRPVSMRRPMRSFA